MTEMVDCRIEVRVPGDKLLTSSEVLGLLKYGLWSVRTPPCRIKRSPNGGIIAPKVSGSRDLVF